MRLPSGEEKRLRFLGAWSKPDVFALMDSSILSLHVEKKNQRLVYERTGGILHYQFRAAANLAAAKRNGDTDAVGALGFIRCDIQDKCKQFLATLDPKIAAEMFDNFRSLVSGTAEVENFKPLYDNGVVTRVKSNEPYTLEFVKPISLVATDVLFNALHRYSKNISYRDRQSCSSSEWGAQFKDFVTSRLVPQKKNLAIKSRSGSEKNNTSLMIHTNFPQYFGSMSETTETSEYPVLYIPTDDRFACDAIIVPVAGNGEPIIIVEISTTDPRDSKRVNKLYKWFSDSALVSQVQALHQNRPIVILLCWDGQLEDSKHVLFKKLEEKALQKNIEILIADQECLRAWS